MYWGLSCEGIKRIYLIKTHTMYKIGLTVYDEDNMLFETKIGNENLKLLFSTWGETEAESKERAESLVAELGKILVNSLAEKTK